MYTYASERCIHTHYKDVYTRIKKMYTYALERCIHTHYKDVCTRIRKTYTHALDIGRRDAEELVRKSAGLNAEVICVYIHTDIY